MDCKILEEEEDDRQNQICLASALCFMESSALLEEERRKRPNQHVYNRKPWNEFLVEDLLSMKRDNL